MLKLENCRDRQKRLLALMEVERLDLAVLANPKTIYYFSGALLDASRPHSLLVTAAGKTKLITNGPAGQSPEPPRAAVDDCEHYTWHSMERDVTPTTWSQEAAALAGRAAKEMVSSGARLGAEFESVSFEAAQALLDGGGQTPQNLTPALDQMRRAKDPDEIECIRKTVELVEAGLAAVKTRLQPGMTEFKAYSIYCEAVVAKAETSVTIHGDFAAGTRAIRGGGPPTSRRLHFGDLYIIDSSPSFNGYTCDFTRTFVVGRPTQLQQDAWGHVMEAHAIAHRLIRPGTRAQRVYEVLKDHLDKFDGAQGSFWHHAGHGIGLSAWELPWLTPGSNHVIEDREVLACEPALYSESLRGGIRLEHDYLVTPEGVTALDHFPMELL